MTDLTPQESLACPNCGHSLVSRRTHSLDDSKVVGCKRCNLKSTLGDWRTHAPTLAADHLTDNDISPKSKPADRPPPLPDSHGPNAPPQPINDIEIGTAATTSSSFHKKIECKQGHKFEVNFSEEGKQVACPTCGEFEAVPKTHPVKTLFGCAMMLGFTFLLCSGCLSMLGSSDRSRSRYNSVDRDMDNFDRHFPDASEEERRLTRELYEQDSDRRGF